MTFNCDNNKYEDDDNSDDDKDDDDEYNSDGGSRFGLLGSECSGSCWDSTTQPTHYSLRLSPLPASTTLPYLTIPFVVVVVRAVLQCSLPNHCNTLKLLDQVGFIGTAKLDTVALCKGTR